MDLSHVFNRLVILLIIVLLIGACNDVEENDTIQVNNLNKEFGTDWIELQLRLVKNTPGFSAPVVARAFGYCGLTFYESLVHGMEKYQSLAGQIEAYDNPPVPDLNNSYHWGVSANSAMLRMSKFIFRNAPVPELSRIDDLYDKYTSDYELSTDPVVFDRSEAFGFSVAEYIIELSKTDGGYGAFNDNFPSDFNPPVGEGLWEPVASEKALHPYWGNNRPFLLINRDNVNPIPPTPYSTSTDSDFHKEAMEVYEAVVNATEEDIEIAFFWTDDPNVTYTPGGHSVNVYLSIVKEEEKPLDFIIYGYAKLGMAINDAFISCWKAKYHFNYIRPITYIQKHVDSRWLPIIITPPFPEYTSGHSVQVGASAEVLTDLFGDNYHFTDYTHDQLELGLSPREFSSFYDFAEEAAISRLYGGIHFMSAINIGVDQGKEIGKNINQLSYLK